ncbi:ABC transporter permease [Bifidobacterium biavatii]|uniref:Raffinose transport system permease n=2 Tax=Bifidobacterium biavatii TaxID=762212 RepID=A0A087A1M5_9BIFI|nr:ABC transporter permease subunit [Bifidobacterium biavatii]KFI52675.1 Raffinose transport system permease [Bifidobacterium biavatii DSM 23969]
MTASKTKTAAVQTVDASGVIDNTAAFKALPWPRKLVWHVQHYWQHWVMALPAMVFVFIFAYIPMYGIQLAFRDFVPSKGLTGGQWVGLKYFNQFFTSPMFSKVMLNTIKISLGTLVLGFIAPIILALLINQIHSTQVKGFVQTITYMPHFISTVVIVAMLNIFLTPNTGLLGRFFGGTSLLDNPNMVAPIYWLSEVWQHCGWNAIIYLAALSSVDVSLYEAAKIDGAGRMQLIRYVDIPTIMPTCVILLIMNMGNILSVGFEKVLLMQNAMNLPGSQVIATYTYMIGLKSFQFSYATAIGLFNTLINFVFLILANWISKRVSDTSIF